MTDEEHYIYEERLGILEVIGEPTLEQHNLAMEDVRRFNLEIEQDILWI